MTTKNMNLNLAAAVAMALAGPAVAAEVDTTQWKCESCPFQTEYEARADVGGAYVSDDSARFGRYNGYDEKGGYLLLDAAGKTRSEGGAFLDYVVRDLGLDTRFARITAGHESGFLSNVKTRGILGEIQLGNILEQIMSAEQYARNVATKRGSRENVEFAVKLPGRDGSGEYRLSAP